MDPFCKSCAKTNLVSLHYVTFIEPLAIFPTKALSFDSKQFTNNSINKVIEEHFFTAGLLYKRNYEVQFQDLSPEVLEFFLEP
jgi:hypothetical protein